MYDYLRDELPALIQTQFNVSDRCAISGHSMGGHGALIMALKNPGKYTSVSAFAPIVNPSRVPWGIKALTAYLGEDESAWTEWDSCELMLASQPQDAIPVLIDQETAINSSPISFSPPCWRKPRDKPPGR